MPYLNGPVALVTAIALLCWFGIWALREATRLERKHYFFLCWSGTLAYIAMFFVLATSPAHWSGLVAVTVIAVVCIFLLMANLVVQYTSCTSKMFMAMVVMGQWLFPFVLMAVPEIERILKSI